MEVLPRRSNCCGAAPFRCRPHFGRCFCDRCAFSQFRSCFFVPRAPRPAPIGCKPSRHFEWPLRATRGVETGAHFHPSGNTGTLRSALCNLPGMVSTTSTVLVLEGCGNVVHSCHDPPSSGSLHSPTCRKLSGGFVTYGARWPFDEAPRSRHSSSSRKSSCRSVGVRRSVLGIAGSGDP